MVWNHPVQTYDGPLVQLVTNSELRDDPSLGWAAHALGGLEIVPIEGNHDAWDDRLVAAAAEQTRAAFGRALERHCKDESA
jgi:hypothetical protein